MRIASRIAAIILSTACMTLPAFAGGYGAIAFSPSTGANAWAHSFPNKQAATNFVMSRCNNQADDCRSFWFVNACGAVAIGSAGGWGTAWAAGANQAQRKALANCAANDYGCRVVRWQCSGGGY